MAQIWNSQTFNRPTSFAANGRAVVATSPVISNQTGTNSITVDVEYEGLNYNADLGQFSPTYDLYVSLEFESESGVWRNLVTGTRPTNELATKNFNQLMASSTISVDPGQDYIEDVPGGQQVTTTTQVAAKNKMRVVLWVKENDTTQAGGDGSFQSVTVSAEYTLEDL